MTRELCALLAARLATARMPPAVPPLVALGCAHRPRAPPGRGAPVGAARATAVSPDEIARLGAEMRAEALHDTLRIRELARVAAALEADGCAPVVFKGAALALTHYASRGCARDSTPTCWWRPAARDGAPRVLGDARVHAPAVRAGRLVMHQEMHVRSDAGARRARGRFALARRQPESVSRCRRTASCARARRGPCRAAGCASPLRPTRWSSPVSTARRITRSRGAAVAARHPAAGAAAVGGRVARRPSTPRGPARWRRCARGGSSSRRAFGLRCRRS